MFQIVKNLQTVGIVEDDNEHAAIADRHDAPRYRHAVAGLFARQQNVVFVLDLLSPVGFGELRQVKWIAEALREFF